MVQNRKPTGRAVSMPCGLLIGSGIGLGITLLLSATVAKLIDQEYMEEDWIGYGVMAALLCGAYIGAMTAAWKVKRQRMLVCTLSGMAHWGLLLAITALFFGGKYEAVGVTAVLVMCGAMLAVFANGSSGRGEKRKKRRITNC